MEFSEELYAVLIDKTEWEINRRLIGAYEREKHEQKKELLEDGDAGLIAYYGMYTWFMKTTGLKQSERMVALMTPKQVKEEELADAVDAWGSEDRDLCYGDQTMTLTDPWKVTALK